MARLILSIVLLCALCSCSSPVKWVAIGDSITYLNDHADETDNRITTGYMSLVVKKNPNITYVNKGYNGWTSGGIAKKIDALDLVPADVYSVFLGTNDWWQGRPVGTIQDYQNSTGDSTLYGAYRIIINKLRALNADAQIILLTPLQRGDFVYVADMKNNAYGSYRDKNGQTLQQFADAIKEIASYEKAVVVDLYGDSGITLENMVKYKRIKDPATASYRNYSYPEYTTIPFDAETHEYPYPNEAIDMTYDGLHPSDKGYEIIASMIDKVIKK